MNVRLVRTETGWPASRWVLVICLLVVIQTALLFVLAPPRAQSLSSLRPLPPLKTAVDPTALERINQVPWLEDPAQFALVTRRGFTGPLWVSPPQPTLRRRSRPRSFGGLALTSVAEPLLAPKEKPAPGKAALLALPPPPARWPGSIQPQAPWKPGTYVEVQGELAGRPLLAQPKLPEWRGPEVLSPSTVQIAVSADGRVLSAVLLPPGSGSAEMDSLAAALAWRFFFAPEQPASGGRKLRWGQLVFHWWPVSPGKTNRIENAKP
ncbi:MAG: hypothetical protein J7M29_06680 [Verrucomicrobia bacterium]|nr:hypothetical protein [Verrucomicrobiota bacterium]